MATITKPMALDESFNTTESTSRNQADVLAGIEQAIVRGFGQVANAVSYDNTDSGLTADNVQDAIDEVDDTVDGLVDDVTEISSDIESTQTASGNPITITDCAPINAESLVVELEPKQDLHGQSAPYVGGAGKNKCPIDLQNGNTGTGMSWTIKTDADGNKIGIVLNGTHVGSSRYFATVASMYLESGNYYLSGAYNDNAALELIGDGVDVYNNNAENPTAFTISTSGTYTLYIAINTNAALNNAELKPMIRLSTETDPTFAPYSNICPITGYDECEVDDVGKNQWSISASYTSSVDGDWVQVDTPISLPAGTYTLSLDDETSGKVSSFYFKNSSNTQIASVDVVSNGSRAYGTFTITESAAVVAVCMYSTARTINNIQIELGSTATTYEPYHSSNATIQFWQTVYGGKSNFTDGVTSDNRHKITVGDIEWGYHGNGLFGTATTDLLLGNDGGEIISSGYKPSNAMQVEFMNDGEIWCYGYAYDPHNIVIKDTRYTDATAFQTANADIEICYVVETPTQLSTPPTDLKLLKGTNNITTNGTTITLEYQPDNVIGELKGEIEKCSPNPEFMHFEVNGNVVDAIPIIFDEAIHSYTVSGDNWKDKTFLCVECCDMRYGILQLVLSSDMAFVDSCGKALMLYPYMHSIEQYIKITISLGQSYGYEISYQTTNTSSLLDYLKIRVRLFN